MPQQQPARYVQLPLPLEWGIDEGTLEHADLVYNLGKLMHAVHIAMQEGIPAFKVYMERGDEGEVLPRVRRCLAYPERRIELID